MSENVGMTVRQAVNSGKFCVRHFDKMCGVSSYRIGRVLPSVCPHVITLKLLENFDEISYWNSILHAVEGISFWVKGKCKGKVVPVLN
jgi:hypothetical protein